MTHGGAIRHAALAGMLFALVGCGSRPTAPQTAAPLPSAVPAAKPAPTAKPIPSDAASADARADGYTDPSKLLEAYDVEAHSVETPSKPTSNSGLVLEVRERGPNQPWLVYLVNRGDAPAELVADTRLLWFEVKTPVKPPPEKATTGKAVKGTNKPAPAKPTKPVKPSLCRLPDTLSTGSVPEPRLVVHLEPGEGVADQFDPRLYCFAEGDQKLLVPGAEIIPHFGWSEAPPRSRWKHGKRVEEPVLQKPPFVARLSAESDSGKRRNAVGNAASPKAVARLSSAGVTGSDKQIQGEAFTLQAEYAIWSHQIPRPPNDSESTDTRSADSFTTPPRLALRLAQGSDAKAEHDATVKLTLSDPSPLPVYVYFRREMVSFEVAGPMGVSQCHGRLDERSPERSAFLHLSPKASHSYDSRLAELCPRGTFAIPGLYLVYARFDATISGQDRGIDAFIGSVYSHRAAPVRIRTGEQAIFQKRPMLRTNVADASSNHVDAP